MYVCVCVCVCVCGVPCTTILCKTNSFKYCDLSIFVAVATPAQYVGPYIVYVISLVKVSYSSNERVEL